MHKILRGVHRFQRDVFARRRAFFEQLVQGQRPEALFITCADSRVSPNEFTQTDPGTLFMLRNAGNLVPPYSAESSGEAATIEYAVRVLGVPNVIVCGHSHCGAMEALLDPGGTRALPSVSQWLAHAEPTRKIVQHNHAGLSRADLLDATVRENVLVQLTHLRTHPAVAEALAQDRLALHGWVYQLESGEVLAFDASERAFLPLNRPRDSLAPPPPALSVAR